MSAFGFMPKFVPALMSGEKPHTIRADRKDGRVPRVGEVFSGYCGMRTTKCTWLFDSTVLRVDRVEIRPGVFPLAYYPQVLVNGRALELDQVATLANRDGFARVRDFREHFVPTRESRFGGFLIHWSPDDARRWAREHACRECGERLRWSAEARLWWCCCQDETFHRLKRPTQTKL